MQQVVIANLLLEKIEPGYFRFMAVILQSLVAPGAQLLLSGNWKLWGCFVFDTNHMLRAWAP